MLSWLRKGAICTPSAFKCDDALIVLEMESAHSVPGTASATVPSERRANQTFPTGWRRGA